MNPTNQKKSILEMVNGAIRERVDVEVNKAVDNIIDPNTEPTAKRTITLKIELKPDKERNAISVSASATAKLAPVTAVGTTLVLTGDENGEMMLAELTPQIPGQMNMDGQEQKAPAILKIAYGG